MDRTDEVILFVAREVSVPAAKVTPSTSLQRDLHLDGDDAVDLLARFARDFRVDMRGFDVSRHFGPEAAFNPLALLAPAWWRDRKSRQDLTVQHLIDAAERGSWPPKAR